MGCFQVNNFVDLVNREQGFRVIGWFKPGSSEEGEMAETFSFHISYLMPSTPLTEEQLGACYHATRKLFLVYLAITQQTYQAV